MPSPTDISLNDRQQEAIETTAGPLLIIAGAGSGKTRVITHRIAALLSAGVPESAILALTFTNKAAREMRERICELIRGSGSKLTISTFHSFGVRILREWITLLGYSRDFSIYDQVDTMSLLKDIVREVFGSTTDIDLYGCAQIVSSIKTTRAVWNEDNEEYRPVYDRYVEHMRAFNAVDFDDLIVLTLSLINSHADVREALASRYEYIMVDEFQDTSITQYRIVEAIAREHRNLCVVGDDDQSIYSWRGANYLNMEYFERDFPERVEIKLEQNYRSARDILTAANSVIANNVNRKEKALWTGLEAERCIEAFFPNDEYDEARTIANVVRSHVARGTVGYADIGILVRTNGSMPPIEEALLSEGIPYAITGGTSFFQRKEIKDMTAYLRICANPDDNVSVLRIINTPKRGIGRKTVQFLRDMADERGESIYSTLNAAAHAADTPIAKKTVEKLAEFIELTERYRTEFLSRKTMAKTFMIKVLS